MVNPLRILMLADSDRELTGLEHAFAALGYAPTWQRADDERRCQALLEANDWDVVMCGFVAGRPPGALRALREWFESVDARASLPPLVFLADAFEEVAEAAQRLGAAVCLRQQGLAHLGPTLENAVRQVRARQARTRWAAFDAGRRLILEHISAGRPLAELLREIVLLIEAQATEGPGEGMLCSILTLAK